MQKKPPSHIKTLNNNIDTDILTNKVPFMKDGKNLLSSSLINHTVIDEIDDLYLSAVSFPLSGWFFFFANNNNIFLKD